MMKSPALLCCVCATILLSGLSTDSCCQAQTSLSSKEQQFALSLTYQVITQETKHNTIIPAYGLFETLAQLEAGSNGQTSRDLQAFLLPALDRSALAAEFQKLRKAGLPTTLALPFQLKENDGYGLLVTATDDRNSDHRLSAAPGDLLLSVDNVPVQSIKRLKESLTSVISPKIPIVVYEIRTGRLLERDVLLRQTVDHNADHFRRPMVFASALWLDKRQSPDPDVLKFLQEQYGVSVQAFDFSRNAMTAAVISETLKKASGDRIHTIYEPPQLPPDTRMVLMNIVDLNAKWRNPFSPSRTTPGRFEAATLESIDVDYMRQTEWFPYYAAGPARFVDLPYADSDLSMLIAIPNQPELMPQLAAMVRSPDFFHQVLRRLKDEELDLALPKFRFASHGSVRDLLRAVGLQKLFSNDADFSPLAGRNDRLKLDDVLHQTLIAVDESGTRVQSEVQATGVALDADTPIPFYCQHPFLFFIHDSRGTVFFAGRVTRPSPARSR